MLKGMLTKREHQVFERLILNKTTREIAEELGISEKTIRNHISNVMQKLGVKARTQAVIELLKLGELSLWEKVEKFFSFFFVGKIIDYVLQYE